MRRIGLPPKVQSLDDLKNTDWFAAVTERMNVYESTADPTTTDIPEGQWAIYRNTTTGIIRLWMNFGGVMVFTDLSSSGGGSVTLTGDTQGTGTGTIATTTKKLNGTQLSGLATGLLKNTTGTGVPSIAAAGTDYTSPTGTENLSNKTYTGASIEVTGKVKSSSASAGVGYATGAGATVAQSTNKSTGVTIDNVCGTILSDAAALAAGAIVSFTVSNSRVAATDVIVIAQSSAGTHASPAAYDIWVDSIDTGTFAINIKNVTAGSLSENVLINFAVIKAVTS